MCILNHFHVIQVQSLSMDRESNQLSIKHIFNQFYKYLIKDRNDYNNIL